MCLRALTFISFSVLAELLPMGCNFLQWILCRVLTEVLQCAWLCNIYRLLMGFVNYCYRKWWDAGQMVEEEKLRSGQLEEKGAVEYWYYFLPHHLYSRSSPNALWIPWGSMCTLYMQLIYITTTIHYCRHPCEVDKMCLIKVMIISHCRPGAPDGIHQMLYPWW